MAALPPEHDLEIVLRRHQRPRRGGEPADREAGPVVQAVDLVDRPAGQQPVLQHGQRPAAPLLRRLEDKAHGPVETAFLAEQLRRTQQHGGVAIVATGVHDALGLGPVAVAALFLKAQGVHVGAQAHGAVPGPAPQGADHAHAADALRHLVEAEFAQLGGDEGRRAALLEAELRVGVQVAPPGGHLQGQGAQIDGHVRPPPPPGRRPHPRAHWRRRPDPLDRYVREDCG